MSIFKSTFKPYVIRQINTRQNLLSEVDRPVDFAHYVSSKAPWIRMTSLVDYEGKPDLAKKYILMGGTLYNKPGTNNLFTRSGVGGAGAAYGGLGTTQYGIRPMPGILSMTTRSLGAYGSLAEATIKFQAWDVKQLEDLSILFLRPGYKVVVEWGWSMYLDTSVTGEEYRDGTTTNALKYAANDYKITNAAFNTIDCFAPTITQTGIYEQLDKLKHRYSGNYDGVLGSIKQFDYTLMPNGSYECTTVLISIGDTIETIRMNDTVGGKINELGKPTEDLNNPSTSSIPKTEQTEEFKSQFELLMDSYCKLDDDNPRSSNEPIAAIDKLIGGNINYIDPFIYTYKDTYVAKVQSIAGNTKLIELVAGSAFTKPYDDPKPVNPETLVDKRSYYYIQFAYLLHILNVFKNVFAERNQKLVDIEIPSDPKNKKSISNGLCQASFNSISIDPNSAIIRNSRATLFTDANGNKGFRPEVFKTEAKYYNGNKATDINLNEFLYDDTNFGTIGNVYINIKEAISLYKQQIVSNNGYVYVGKYISDILSKVSFSLGSINDFDKFIKDDKVVIIDKHYTEISADSKYTSKFKINVSGNNSIVRNHKIQSKIFPSQATMIAIAAQDRENISAIQTSTYNYLNKGLTDRLFGKKVNSRAESDTGVSELAAKRSKLTAILKLIQFVNNYVMVNSSMGSYYSTNVGTMNGYLNTLLVEMEGGTDYKAIVPISVDLTTDGLSGLTIGEIFTVDKKVLPKDYENKAVGFIITGISNEVVTNAWTTSISSQMCLLDQDQRQILTRQKAETLLKELQGESENKKVENQTSAIYFNILAALAMDVLMQKLVVKSMEGIVEIDNTKKPLYTRAAISEFANGLFDFNYVLKDFQTSYNQLYPKKISDESSTYFQSIKSNTDDFLVKEKDGSLFTVVNGRKTFINPRKNIEDNGFLKTGVSVTTRNILSSEDYNFYSEEYRFVNIKDRTALFNIIQNMSLYKAIVGDSTTDIKRTFNSEFNSVTSKIEKNKGLVEISFTKEQSGSIIKFRILDILKVTDKLGLLTVPLPLVEGYKYIP